MHILVVGDTRNVHRSGIGDTSASDPGESRSDHRSTVLTNQTIFNIDEQYLAEPVLILENWIYQRVMAGRSVESPFEELDVEPIERTNVRKAGGSLTMTLRADSARAIGLDPGDISPDDDIELLISESKEHDTRLVFDLVERP
jgi:hypothetical protein